MGFSILVSTSIILLGFVSGRALAAKPSYLDMPEFVETDQPGTQVSVPDSIQKDMYRSAQVPRGHLSRR